MALSISFLATRWGTLIGGINQALSFAGGNVGTRADSILAQYSGLTNQAEVTDDLYEQAINVQGDVVEWAGYLRDLCELVLSTMSRDDSARPKSNSIPDLFEKLKRDMIAAGEVFDQPVVTANVSAVNAIGTANSGDGYLIASNIEPVDGLTTYYATAEVIRVLCESDSYANEVGAGSEGFSVHGETAVDVLNYLWPKGSGESITIQAFAPDTAGILEGGLLDDDDWTGTSLTDWSAVGGTFGAAANGVISKSTSASYTPDVDGDAFALMTGDGALHLGIYQVLDQDVVKSNTNYAFQFWIKASSGAGTTTLAVALRNSSAAVITDNFGSSQSVSISDTTVNASNGVWTRVSGVLRTPKNLPTELRFDIRTATAALTAARTLGIDHIELIEMVRLYPGSPYFAIGSGVTPFAKTDGFTIIVANNKGRTNYVRSLDGIFGLADQDIRLQVSTTATINDNRIS